MANWCRVGNAGYILGKHIKWHFQTTRIQLWLSYSIGHSQCTIELKSLPTGRQKDYLNDYPKTQQYETLLSYYIHSLVGGGSISAKMRSVVYQITYSRHNNLFTVNIHTLKPSICTSMSFTLAAMCPWWLIPSCMPSIHRPSPLATVWNSCVCARKKLRMKKQFQTDRGMRKRELWRKVPISCFSFSVITKPW